MAANEGYRCDQGVCVILALSCLVLGCVIYVSTRMVIVFMCDFVFVTDVCFNLSHTYLHCLGGEDHILLRGENLVSVMDLAR